MVAVAGLFGALAWTSLRAGHRLGHTPVAPLVVGLSFGLVAHAVHGLVDAVAIGSKTGFVPWAFAGTLVAIRLRGRAWESGPALSAGESKPSAHRYGWAQPLAAWIATSALAVYLATTDSAFAAAVTACCGGAVFGVLSARRFDGRRERIRRRRTRRKRTGS
jgi:hypothetical protein